MDDENKFRVREFGSCGGGSGYYNKIDFVQFAQIDQQGYYWHKDPLFLIFFGPCLLRSSSLFTPLFVCDYFRLCVCLISTVQTGSCLFIS